MSTSGFREQGGDGAPRQPWRAPRLSVLVFRATANGSSPGSDAAFPDQPPSPPPPPQAPAPPPPPPPSKGSLQCDGPVQVAAGTGMTSVTTPRPRPRLRPRRPRPQKATFSVTDLYSPPAPEHRTDILHGSTNLLHKPLQFPCAVQYRVHLNIVRSSLIS